MLEAYATHGGNIIAVEPVPDDEAKNYGVVSVAGKGDGSVFPVDGMVEKPAPGTAPSNLTILGRYILQPEIFDDSLGARDRRRRRDPDHRRHEQALGAQPFHALKYEGRTFDCGSKLGFLLANVAYGLDRPDIAPALAAELKKLL